MDPLAHLRRRVLTSPHAALGASVGKQNGVEGRGERAKGRGERTEKEAEREGERAPWEEGASEWGRRAYAVEGRGVCRG